jgi:peptidoglycan/xylan/chitin deacetylase (PgdA/CDA1 family)
VIARLLRPPAALVHHGVGPPIGDPRRLLTPSEHLESQIRFLQRMRYRFVTAEELLQEGTLEPGVVALTFDDGFQNWLTEAVPLLHRLGVRGTFYVCPGQFGGQHPEVSGESGRLLDERGVQELVAKGMEVGSHTLTHPDLRTLDDAALASQLRESKTALETITGRPCRTFAYPYGAYDERVTAAVAAADYELAFAWLPGPWRPLEAPRLPAPTRNGAFRLALKLRGIRRRRP